MLVNLGLIFVLRGSPEGNMLFTWDTKINVGMVVLAVKAICM